MNPPTAAQLLTAWENAAGLPPGRRSLALLTATLPDSHAGRAALEKLSVGRIDALLLDLRRACFGSQIIATAHCPRCRETVEMEFSIDAIRVRDNSDADHADVANASFAPSSDFNLSGDDWTVTVRLPTPLDLDAVCERRSARGAGEGGALVLFERCVCTAEREGKTISAHELPPAVLAAVSDAFEARDPQAATELALRCPSCAHAWDEVFDPGAFLWAELDAWADGMLRDIDALAREYGWSENEILALSPRRRRRYVEMICA